MTDAPYLFIGDHADVLASGRPLTPGEEVPANAVDPDGDQRLLDDGLLVSQEPQQLTGAALDQRAVDLDIEGRASMTAAQKRRAVARAERAQTSTTTDQEG